MNVDVFLYGTVKKDSKNHYTYNLTEKITLGELVQILEIKNKRSIIFLVNGKVHSREDAIYGGEEIHIIPIQNGG